jgi:pyruvate dehydrogenase E2 component (dihydrolipoamide acetyltransferase)
LRVIEPPDAAASVSSTGRVKASPYVRMQARERGIDLTAIAGSGPGGRIVARDLERARPALARPAPAQPPTAAPPSRPALHAIEGERPPEVRPLSMMRKTIARRLTESKREVPHFYLTVDVDAAPLVELRSRLNGDLAAGQAADPPKVSFNDLVIKAAAIAITRSPTVNASFTPEALIYHRRVDISVAVAIDDGLVTPVVRAADQKSVLEISSEVRDLATRARDRRLTVDEMTDGTFSISNLGMYGIDDFAAVINPPEGAILAVGSIRSVPVVDGERVVAGKRMMLTLSCDHRVVDGAVGAAYLSALRAVLEHPTQILAF